MDKASDNVSDDKPDNGLDNGPGNATENVTENPAGHSAGATTHHAGPGTTHSTDPAASEGQRRQPVMQAVIQPEAAERLDHRLREVELEATLRFGAREMTLGEVLELGPGDVIELDRQVHDAIDLLVGDKIVARGVAVLTEGRYGLRITEISETRPTLESIRCLF